MKRKEMEFIIQVIKEHKQFLREDARMSEKAIREDEYLNQENIMANYLIKEFKNQIKKQRRTTNA